MASGAQGNNAGWGQGGYGLGQYGSPAIQFLTPGWFLQRVTSEYQLSPLFLKWLSVPLNILNDINLCAVSFVTAFDVDYAVGPQLDILGTIVGISRYLSFQPSGGISPEMDDATYRVVIKAQIGLNQWDGTQDGIYSTWQFIFPGTQIAILDLQDMSAVVLIPETLSPIIQQLVINGFLVPRPQSVEYRYSFSSLPIVGCDQVNARVVGVDDNGHLT